MQNHIWIEPPILSTFLCYNIYELVYAYCCLYIREYPKPNIHSKSNVNIYIYR